MSARRATRIVDVADARRRAARSLPRVLFEYIEGGADEELNLAEDKRAFRGLQIMPRMGVDVGEPSLATTALGVELKLPVMLAPCGFIQMLHPDGAVGVARAAATAGTLAVLSRSALCGPEEVAERAGGPRWFQVNAIGGPEEVQRLIDRAAAAGFTGLVITLDGPPPGNHVRNLRNGVLPPVRVTPRLLGRLTPQLLARPRWTAAVAPAAARALAGRVSSVGTASQVLKTRDLHEWPRFSWSAVGQMREEWTGPVIVKGVLRPEDALAAQGVGVDAIIVSNHGGRQIDGVPAPISVLPEVAAAVGGATEVYLDGGVRHATDVIKALCLGAKAVLVGRPFLYGLATAGQPGVERVIEIFRSEISRTLKLMGCGGVAELGPQWLRPAATSISFNPAMQMLDGS
jgi:L-lactate dehydrogenase (cytochrome)